MQTEAIGFHGPVHAPLRGIAALLPRGFWRHARGTTAPLERDAAAR
jgi:hypothetical protein